MNWLANSELWVRYLWASKVFSGISIDINSGKSNISETKTEKSKMVESLMNIDFDALTHNVLSSDVDTNTNTKIDTENSTTQFSNPLIQIQNTTEFSEIDFVM